MKCPGFSSRVAKVRPKLATIISSEGMSLALHEVQQEVVHVQQECEIRLARVSSVMNNGWMNWPCFIFHGREVKGYVLMCLVETLALLFMRSRSSCREGKNEKVETPIMTLWLRTTRTCGLLEEGGIWHSDVLITQSWALAVFLGCLKNKKYLFLSNLVPVTYFCDNPI